MGLNEIVEQVVNKDVPDTKVEETPEGTEVTVDTEEETEEANEEESEDEEEVEELSETQIKEAQDLYKALKNPNTAKEVIALLAKQQGLDQPESKAAVKDSKKKILDIFEEALGDEFKFIAPRISKGVEVVLEQERQERENQLQVERARAITLETKNAWDALVKRTGGEAKKFEAKINDIAIKFRPGPNTSPKEYLDQLYTLATAGKSNVQNSKTVINKIQKNANDTSGRLRATGGNAGNDTGKPPEIKNVKQAVDFAYDQLSKKANRK